MKSKGKSGMKQKFSFPESVEYYDLLYLCPFFAKFHYNVTTWNLHQCNIKLFMLLVKNQFRDFVLFGATLLPLLK